LELSEASGKPDAERRRDFAESSAMNTLKSDIGGDRLGSGSTNPASELHGKLANLYLNLLEQALTGAILEDVGFIAGPNDPNPVHADRYDERARLIGIDWPSRAHTMVGLTRLRRSSTSMRVFGRSCALRTGN